MPGIYRPRHPERTVLYRVLFHYFERFLTEYEGRFEREYGYFRPIIKEVVERYLDCRELALPAHLINIRNVRNTRLSESKGQISDVPDVSDVIWCVEVDLAAYSPSVKKPPPYHVLCEIALMAAEESGEYE